MEERTQWTQSPPTGTSKSLTTSFSKPATSLFPSHRCQLIQLMVHRAPPSFWPCLWQKSVPVPSYSEAPWFTSCESYFVCFLIELHPFNILFHHARLFVLMFNFVSQMAGHPIQLSVISNFKSKFSILSSKLLKKMRPFPVYFVS